MQHDPDPDDLDAREAAEFRVALWMLLISATALFAILSWVRP